MAGAAWTPNAFRWQLAPCWDGTDGLAHRLRTGRLVAQLLHNRGLDDAQAAQAYLAPKLTDLHDPQQLHGAAQAAELIHRTVRDGGKIVLYGDYDVDGLTGVAILYRGLKMLSANVDYYIPHRIEEGYGLHAEALETLAGDGANLVITVDCGITAVTAAERAAELGLTLIVTDHHSLGSALPPAAGIVHPALGEDYPNADLCGAGVALKLAWEVCRAACGSNRVSEKLKDFLLEATCMAALGTIADVAPLTGENRVLATFGLKGLPATHHPGLRALIAASKLTGRRLGAYDVGFLLAPRLNAAGRMGHAGQAAELLIRGDEIDCQQAARSLTDLNTKRQQIEREIYQEATDMVEQGGLARPDRRAIVLAKAGWHAGVLGIVAARLVRRFHRPAVVISLDGATGAGSARSIEGYHIAHAFADCRDHLLSHGGHAMAAGLKVAADRVDTFAADLTDHAGRHISPEMLSPVLHIDAEVTLAELALPMVRQIESMAPFGAGNPPVILAVRDAAIHAAPQRMGRNGATLGLLVSAGRARLRCVGFGMGDAADRLTGVRSVDLAGQPVINTFNGRSNVELHLKDLRWGGESTE